MVTDTFTAPYPILSACVDGYANMIYYSVGNYLSSTSGILYRINTENFNDNATVDTNLALPSGLCYSMQELYWVNVGFTSGTGTINKLTDPVDGRGVQVVYGGLDTEYPFLLTSVNIDTMSGNGWIAVYNLDSQETEIYTGQDNDSPSIPTWISISPISTYNNSWALSWNPSSDFNGISQYLLEISTTSSFSGGTTNDVYVNGTSYTDTEQALGTYYYQVRAENIMHYWSNFSSILEVNYTTLPTTLSNGSSISGFNICMLIGITAVTILWLKKKWVISECSTIDK